MTDKEIIKDLESSIRFIKRYIRDTQSVPARCSAETIENALDLINRQKAEIERWQGGYMTQKQEISNLEIELKSMRGAANSYKAEVERLKEKDETRHKVFMTKCEELDIAKAEAVKEVAERLKDKTCQIKYSGRTYIIVDIDDIDNLVKGEKTVGDG